MNTGKSTQKLLDIKMSTFRFNFKCYWHEGKFVDLEDSNMDTSE